MHALHLQVMVAPERSLAVKVRVLNQIGILGGQGLAFS